MKKKLEKMNQFKQASFLEIFYNENDKVIEFIIKIKNYLMM